MNEEIVNDRLRFRFLPEVRLSKEYPWQAWIIGWFAITKSFFWVFTDPIISDPVLKILGYKYLIYMIPLLVCGVGLWNLRKWAVWCIILLSITELLFFLLYPASLTSIAIVKNSLISLMMSIIVMLVNGPISNIIILIASPVLLKHARKYTLLSEKIEANSSQRSKSQ